MSNSPTATQYQNSLLGLKRQPRIVDSAPNAAGWDASFLFEDRRNVFYVTTSESYLPIYRVLTYGIIATPVYTLTSAPSIPVLVVDTPAPVVNPTPFATGVRAGATDPAGVASFVAQNPLIHTALGTVSSVVYQGTTLYPTGQATEQVAPFQGLAVADTKEST